MKFTKHTAGYRDAMEAFHARKRLVGANVTVFSVVSDKFCDNRVTLSKYVHATMPTNNMCEDQDRGSVFFACDVCGMWHGTEMHDCEGWQKSKDVGDVALRMAYNIAHECYFADGAAIRKIYNMEPDADMQSLYEMAYTIHDDVGDDRGAFKPGNANWKPVMGTSQAFEHF